MASSTIALGLVLCLSFLLTVRGDSVLFRSNEYFTGALGYGPYQSYFSANYTPAEWNFAVPVNASAASSLSSGYIFSAPRGVSVLQSGATIYDQSGSLVWDGSIYGATLSFSVVTYLGEPHIILWTGTVLESGVGSGYDILLNSNYELVENFTVNLQGATGPTLADFHEAQITTNNTALMTAYQATEYDLSSVDGPADGWLLDSVMQELNITSNEPIFTWIASDHVNATLCYTSVGTGGGSVAEAFDYFHINSIEKDSSGNYLISSRHCWTVYYLNGTSGDIIWSMGGMNSSFAMGNGTSFSFQHHARWVDLNETYGTMTVFDNGGRLGETEEPMSRGLYLGLNFTNMSVELLQEFLPFNASITQSQGSVQIQPNGNFLVGFGQLPWTGEYTAAGELIWTTQFGVGDVESYRALRYNWTGTPTNPPSVEHVHSLKNNLTSFYASWNGATEIVKWELFGAADSSGSNSVSLYNQTKTGFETTITISTAAHSYNFYAVRAVGSSEKVLGTSPFLSVNPSISASSASSATSDIGATAAPTHPTNTTSSALRISGQTTLAVLSACIVLSSLY